MLPSLLVLPDSWWTLQVFFSSGKLRITSIPFVLISDLVHHSHLGFPVAFLTLLRWAVDPPPDSWLSVVPANFRCCIVWFISLCSLSLKLLFHLSLLTDHLIFQSIYNFSERTKIWCLKCISVSWVKAWTLFPKACSSSSSCMPCLYPFCCWFPQ